MKIYIDFDDVLCETARNFTELAREMFGIEVPYENMQFFNLQKTFQLDDEQYPMLMRAAHIPENLLSYAETPGASETVNKWIDEGHEVSIITGRPLHSYEPSRQWLDEHHLERVPLFCVDKYGRENANPDAEYSLTLEELYQMHFDFVVEDSPVSFQIALHFEDCRVAVFDRPWNRSAELPNERFVRCADWKEIDVLLKKYSTTYCGTDCCKACSRLSACGGCRACGGHPFGGSCVAQRNADFTKFKKQLVADINALQIDDLTVNDLYLLSGAYVNLAYPLANGTSVQFLNDTDVYLGNQIEKADSDRCYGVVANEEFILVCEYGCNGAEPELLVYKKR